MMTRPSAIALTACVLAVTAGCRGCRDTGPPPPGVSDATYREAVTAFYTGLAAMQTSQDVMARQSLERVTAIVPQEPAKTSKVHRPNRNASARP